MSQPWPHRGSWFAHPGERFLCFIDNARKAGSPTSETLRYLCISARASALIAADHHHDFLSMSAHSAVGCAISRFSSWSVAAPLRGCLLQPPQPFPHFRATLPSYHTARSVLVAQPAIFLFFSLACSSFYSSSLPYQGGFPRRDFKVLKCQLFADFLRQWRSEWHPQRKPKSIRRSVSAWLCGNPSTSVYVFFLTPKENLSNFYLLSSVWIFHLFYKINIFLYLLFY